MSAQWEYLTNTPDAAESYEDFDLFLDNAAPVYRHVRATFFLNDGARSGAELFWIDKRNPDGTHVNSGTRVTLSVSELEAMIGAQVLMDPDGSIFPPELSGFAASEAALYLQRHWAECQPPLSARTKASDVQNVIDVLARWHAHIVQTGR